MKGSDIETLMLAQVCEISVIYSPQYLLVSFCCFFKGKIIRISEIRRMA